MPRYADVLVLARSKELAQEAHTGTSAVNFISRRHLKPEHKHIFVRDSQDSGTCKALGETSIQSSRQDLWPSPKLKDASFVAYQSCHPSTPGIDSKRAFNI